MCEITCSTLNKLWSYSHTVWHNNHISSRWVPVSLQWVRLRVTAHFYPDVMISELFSSHDALATNLSLFSNTLGQWRIHFMFWLMRSIRDRFGPLSHSNPPLQTVINVFVLLFCLFLLQSVNSEMFVFSFFFSFCRGLPAPKANEEREWVSNLHLDCHGV